MTIAPKRKQLGTVLVEKGFISEDQLRIALLEQKKSGAFLGKALINLGFITDAVIRDALSDNIGQASADLSHIVIGAETLKMVPQDMARRHTMIPVSLDQGSAAAYTGHGGHLQRRGPRPGPGTASRNAPDRTGPRRRDRHSECHRAVLPVRTVHRRHPAGDRDR